jgi:hypothetical protein
VTRLTATGSAGSATDFDYFDTRWIPTQVNTLAVQSDGKVVVGGSTVVRINTDGQQDGTFQDPRNLGEVRSLFVRSDGKIIIGGEFFNVGLQPRRGVARLNSNGTLDTAFLNVDVFPVLVAIPKGTDRIVIGGGFTSVGGQPQPGVALING